MDNDRRTREDDPDADDTGEARAVYHSLVKSMRRSVLGLDRIVARLALLGAEHVWQSGAGGRCVLAGPPGSGKTTLALALAQALGVPSRLIDCGALAETNWRGSTLPDEIAGLVLSANGDIRRAQRGVIVLDEIDKVGLVGSSGIRAESVTALAREGQQNSLLSLCGGGDVRFPLDAAATAHGIFSAARCMVIACGVFPHAPNGDLVPQDLIDHGIKIELVERLFGDAIRLPHPSREILVELLRRRVETVAVMYRRYGYQLSCGDETLRLLASCCSNTSEGVGTRSIMSWLEAMARTRLVEMLESGVAEGHRSMLTPDDVVPFVRSTAGRQRGRRT